MIDAAAVFFDASIIFFIILEVRVVLFEHFVNNGTALVASNIKFFCFKFKRKTNNQLADTEKVSQFLAWAWLAKAKGHSCHTKKSTLA